MKHILHIQNLKKLKLLSKIFENLLALGAWAVPCLEEPPAVPLCPQPVPTKQDFTAAIPGGNYYLSAQTFYYQELSRMRAWKISLFLQNSWKKCKGRSESSGAYGEKDTSCAFPENQHHFQQGTADGLGWEWSHWLGRLLASNASQLSIPCRAVWWFLITSLTKPLETGESLTIAGMAWDLCGQVLTLLLMQFILSTV